MATSTGALEVRLTSSSNNITLSEESSLVAVSVMAETTSPTWSTPTIGGVTAQSAGQAISTDGVGQVAETFYAIGSFTGSVAIVFPTASSSSVLHAIGFKESFAFKSASLFEQTSTETQSLGHTGGTVAVDVNDLVLLSASQGGSGAAGAGLANIFATLDANSAVSQSSYDVATTSSIDAKQFWEGSLLRSAAVATLFSLAGAVETTPNIFRNPVFDNTTFRGSTLR